MFTGTSATISPTSHSLSNSTLVIRDQYIPAETGMIPMPDLVLVTEASGYIGSHIVEHLLEAGYRVRGVVKPGMISSIRAAYSGSKHNDRFEAVGIANLDREDLTHVFRDVNAIILASLPPVEGQTMQVANLIVESASSGTKHVLKFARAAKVTRVIYTGSFSNMLHPDDSWKPIVVTEKDWNSQTADDCKKFGLHPWCMHTAAQVIAEREVWKFADDNPAIDVTSILPGFPFGPYGRGQAVDLRSGTFAWIFALLNGPPGRTLIPNAPPYSPNYVHIADVARAHVAALRAAPTEPPNRKRIPLIAGYVLWSEVTVHLAKVIPEIRGRLPSPTCGAGLRSVYAQFEAKNAKEILGIVEYRSWQKAIEDAVKNMLSVESKNAGHPG